MVFTIYSATLQSVRIRFFFFCHTVSICTPLFLEWILMMIILPLGCVTLLSIHHHQKQSIPSARDGNNSDLWHEHSNSCPFDLFGLASVISSWYSLLSSSMLDCRRHGGDVVCTVTPQQEGSRSDPWGNWGVCMFSLQLPPAVRRQSG